MNNLSACIGRVLLAILFIFAGLHKIGGYEATAAYMSSQGVPGLLLPLVILTELGGGLLILVGWQTRIVAFLLAGFCVLAGLIFHADDVTGMLKNFALAGGFLVLVAHGAGQWSLDDKLSKTRTESH